MGGGGEGGAEGLVGGLDNYAVSHSLYDSRNWDNLWEFGTPGMMQALHAWTLVYQDTNLMFQFWLYLK